MDDLKANAIWLAGIVAVIFGVYSCSTSDWHAARERERVADRLQEQTPHLFRDSPDGCKVFRFKAEERWQYYTRCPDGKVSTQTNWQECRLVGKVSSCTNKSRTIETTMEAQ
ncbi:hypothetical protein GCM10027082_23970 [Comamonas humi]